MLIGLFSAAELFLVLAAPAAGLSARATDAAAIGTTTPAPRTARAGNDSFMCSSPRGWSLPRAHRRRAPRGGARAAQAPPLRRARPGRRGGQAICGGL